MGGGLNKHVRGTKMSNRQKGWDMVNQMCEEQ